MSRRLSLVCLGFVACAVTRIDNGAHAGQLALADVDGDADLDIVNAAADQSLHVLQNDGAGHFSAPAAIPFAGDSAFALGDLDGDGDVDIAAFARFGDVELDAVTLF